MTNSHKTVCLHESAELVLHNAHVPHHVGNGEVHINISNRVLSS